MWSKQKKIQKKKRNIYIYVYDAALDDWLKKRSESNLMS